MNFREKGTCYIKKVDLFNISFIYDPRPTEEATNLVPLADITTYHEFNCRQCFAPSIAEVIAQIPEEYLGRVAAFEIIEKPETATDLNLQKEAVNDGYHVAKTRLYTKE